VRTIVSLLDITDASYAFRNRHLVDGRGRVIYESEVVPSFDMLRVALVPLERPRRIRGTVAYLSNTKPGNYGHWLFFTLPMIRYYRRSLVEILISITSENHVCVSTSNPWRCSEYRRAEFSSTG
jgi:hypothetical protein